MRRRQFALGSISAATMPALGLAGCGGGDDVNIPFPLPSPVPVPIPASESRIRLPADHYLHRGAPTEWYWHIGTLKAGNRTFGFEINAASFIKDGFAFSQIMLADISNNKHYQRTTPYVAYTMFDPNNWAQNDFIKDWSVKLGNPVNQLGGLTLLESGSGYTSAPTVVITGGGGALGSGIATINAATGEVATVVLTLAGLGYTSLPVVTLQGGGGTGATAVAFQTYITMDALWSDPSQNMVVKAQMLEDTPSATKSVITFDLKLSQKGQAFIVWGTGVHGSGGGSGAHLDTDNYYYSLTRLQTTGAITIDGERFAVSGTTWMDHEYGAFGTAANPVKWMLQDMQLDNDVCLSNFATFETGVPTLNTRTKSQVTVQRADGTTYFVNSFVTPVGRTWTSPATNTTFFLQFLVEVPLFNASLTVTSLMDSQEFPVAGKGVYEGVAVAAGSFEGKAVTGTAWNEQAL